MPDPVVSISERATAMVKKRSAPAAAEGRVGSGGGGGSRNAWGRRRQGSIGWLWVGDRCVERVYRELVSCATCRKERYNQPNGKYDEEGSERPCPIRT